MRRSKRISSNNSSHLSDPIDTSILDTLEQYAYTPLKRVKHENIKLTTTDTSISLTNSTSHKVTTVLNNDDTQYTTPIKLAIFKSNIDKTTTTTTDTAISSMQTDTTQQPPTIKRKRKRNSSTVSNSLSSTARVYCNLPWHPHKPHHNHTPHTLILGSMTGSLGLQLKQYYAHKQNQFYNIIYNILNIEYNKDIPYEDRIDALLTYGICIWNVLASCIRPGSLDSSIKSPVSNNIYSLLSKYSSIKTIGLNGQWAYEYFHKTILKEQPELHDHIIHNNVRVVKLMSSSPAAAMKDAVQTKTKQWQDALQIHVHHGRHNASVK